MSLCPSALDGKHCSCIDASKTGVCCYCNNRITPDVPDVTYDDGSEENKDADFSS